MKARARRRGIIFRRSSCWSILRACRGSPRSVIDADTPIPSQGTWHPIKWREGWHWKGDTSSDEITGHLFAYSIFAQLVPKGDAEKKRALAPLEAIMSNLVKNNLTLIDITGLPTTWGRWDPETINDVRDRSDGRGVNSLQIIAYLASAYRCTGEVKYQDAARALLAQGYDHNLINLKIENPGDDNFSDDELTFLPYFEFYGTGCKNLHSATCLVQLSTRVSAARLTLCARRGPTCGPLSSSQRPAGWQRRSRHPSRSGAGRPCVEPRDVATGSGQLSSQQLCARVDVLFNPLQDRFHRSNNRGLSVLPANERSQLRWNANPFEAAGRMTRYTMPRTLRPGCSIVNWMARYYKLVQS